MSLGGRTDIVNLHPTHIYTAPDVHASAAVAHANLDFDRNDDGDVHAHPAYTYVDSDADRNIFAADGHAPARDARPNGHTNAHAYAYGHTGAHAGCDRYPTQICAGQR